MIAGAALVALWVGLPVRLPLITDGATHDSCLTLADRAPRDQSALRELERCAQMVPDDPELLADLAGVY